MNADGLVGRSRGEGFPLGRAVRGNVRATEPGLDREEQLEGGFRGSRTRVCSNPEGRGERSRWKCSPVITMAERHKTRGSSKVEGRERSEAEIKGEVEVVVEVRSTGGGDHSPYLPALCPGPFVHWCPRTVKYSKFLEKEKLGLAYPPKWEFAISSGKTYNTPYIHNQKPYPMSMLSNRNCAIVPYQLTPKAPVCLAYHADARHASRAFCHPEY